MLFIGRLHILANATVERLVATPFYAARVEQVSEFFGAVGVQPVEGCGWPICSDVALDGADKFFECFAGDEAVEGVSSCDLRSALDASYQAVDTFPYFRVEWSVGLPILTKPPHDPAHQDSIRDAKERAQAVHLGSPRRAILL